ncbi:conserved hypothetical protein [Solidesulfovibrio fructosivorans JJ]]|uniref:Uncharacterized protein n=1 Tax=Solidesulfovibrio fructosivorans JJ] TaxID=596151 RepID=E1JR11_SOLFR|nr:hypothetical protein [Solidesulfovibrio fructosivorans]EFL53012.1 conserved hypothetical protein [Solidesulfovibrio fructosivorans JJ]]
MINGVLLKTGGLIVAVLLVALAWQSVGVARLQTRLAFMSKELGEANASIAQLQASEQTLLAARDGLTRQVEDCQQANASDQARTADRTVIIRNAKPVPARAGKVVDDATSRKAAVHLNSCPAE